MNLSDESRIYGCWLGKSIGGTLGLPAEGRTERLGYTFYDPIPTEAPPNDDLELQLVWLALLETRGLALTQQDFVDAWRDHMHYMWDEYGRSRWNLRRGVPASDLGTFENPFHAGMGSPIRSEIWACLCRGDAALAAAYAALDAALDHGPEGIAGEVFLAAFQSRVYAGEDIPTAYADAIARIEASTETARALGLTHRLHSEGVEAWAARDHILADHGSPNFTHTPLNLALTLWALLYGAGDFEQTILLAVNGGYDTDCTAATAGATLGFARGRDGIPARWTQPIGDGVSVGPGIVDVDCPKTLGELTRRTLALADRLASLPADQRPALEAPAAPQGVSLDGRPGTLTVTAADGQTALWANGELPSSVKDSGSGSWTWTVTEPGKVHLSALAPQGIRLFVDGRLVVDCPPDLPFVPATHRTPPGSQVPFDATVGAHEIRVELGRMDGDQPASVLLSEANQHLAPWTGEALPHRAILPA